jgi:hypothetical protein
MRKHPLRISLSRRTAGATGALVVVVIAIVAVISAGSPSASKGASTSGHDSGSTTVQYRNLIATDTESGTLSYANPQTVYNRLDGTITWLPAVGQIVKPGGTLFDVDNAPVILFDGTTPAYRDLDSSDSVGPDILELNRDLKSMGYDPNNEITVNNAWQAGTTDAVERWQGSLDATETGTISLGQIVFLPGRQEIDTLDTTVGSTGSGTGDGNAAAGDTDYEPGTAHAEFASLTTTTTPAAGATGATGATGPTGPTSDATARDAADTCNGLDVQQNENGSPSSDANAGDKNASDPSQTGESLPTCNQKGTTGATGTTGSKNPSQEAVLLALLKAETLELKKTLGASGQTGRGTTGTTTGGTGSGGRQEELGGGGGGASSVGSGGSADTGSGAGGSADTGSGSAGAGATAILQTSSTNVIVSVPLPATNQSEAVVGERVQVEMPAGSTVEGKITIVSPIATSSGSSGSGSTGGSGSSSSATIPVTIALLSRHLPTTGLDQAAVSVDFAQEVRNHVLSVPVTALLATAGGGYAVQEAGSPHKLIPVTPGLFAAGDVQITGSGIYPGLQVTDSQG